MSALKLLKLSARAFRLYLSFRRGKYCIIWPWEYELLINKLAKMIEQSNFQPTCLIDIPRGGYRTADRLSRLFGIPIAELPAQSYPDSQTRATPHIQYSRTLARKWPAEDDEKYFSRPLILDDIFQTGRTLGIAREIVLKTGKKFVKEIRTAVLVAKDPLYQMHEPVEFPGLDFFVKVVPLNTWILQHFEWYGPGKITLKDL